MRGLVMLAVLVSALPAGAQTAAPGNLPPGFYPQPACEKPSTPPKSPGNGDQDAIMAYNLRIRAYNTKNVAFHDCIKGYVDKAQNDIGQIQAIVHAAVEEANRP